MEDQMKTKAIFILALFCVVGCADELATGGSTPDESETVAKAQEKFTGWLGPISEEASINNKDCNQADIGVTGAYCSGAYCDNVWLGCVHLPTGVHAGIGSPTGRWFSEEQPNYYDFCTDSNGYMNGIVTGLSASGSNSDNLQLHCAALQFDSGHSYKDCEWTGWSSEENGGYASIPAGAYVTGIACSGYRCDNMAFHACIFN
jgi:hypothetical protein